MTLYQIKLILNGSFKSRISQSLAKTNFNKINLNFLQSREREVKKVSRSVNKVSRINASSYIESVFLEGECYFHILKGFGDNDIVAINFN